MAFSSLLTPVLELFPPVALGQGKYGLKARVEEAFCIR